MLRRSRLKKGKGGIKGELGRRRAATGGVTTA